MSNQSEVSLPLEGFGRYEVLGLIGRGAFADVVRAWDEALSSHVAIKVLNQQASGDPFLRRRFVEEGQLLRRVRSDHVLGVHDVGELGDGRPYLVVDLADGGTLADRLERHGATSCDQASAQRIADALANGLTATHDAGIIHRDIKPDNLLILSGDAGRIPNPSAATVVREGLLAPDERLLIGDLGLAKDLDRRGSAPSVIGGSAGYQAPEQLRADSTDIGPPTDTYGASAVMWRLLTGHEPPEPHDIADQLGNLPSGWQAFFERAMNMSATRRFPTAIAWLSAVLDHLDAEPIAAQATATDRTVSATCPYKGLAAFQPEDADSFFGREDLVDELVRRLQQQRVLVVAGPSGSGKSSVVRAGLLPAVHRGALPGGESWHVELFTPGPRPFAELHYRLTRRAKGEPRFGADRLRDDPQLARYLLDDADPEGSGAPLLLCIDQFEELFTQSSDERMPAAFVDALAAMADPIDSRLRIVIAVRADFYGRCAQIAWLADRITANQVLVGPMDREGMRHAIEEPARRAGLRLEHGLVDAVLEEGGHESSSLPLMSHALVETWVRREAKTLTLDGFRSAGGVAGAIAQSADTLFEEALDARQKKAARRLLLRLVTPGEGTADSRRKMPLDRLDRDVDPDAIEQVVDAFVAARLLTVDRSTVEIAHEALISSWPRLRDWIETERENLRTQQRIGRAAHEWDVSGRDPDLLYRGAPLEAATDWAHDHRDTLDSLEQDFLERAEAAREAEQAAQAAEAERANRTRRRATIALASLALASVIASLVAFTAFRRASDNADVASQQFANALGTSALGQADSDPALALLLAVESMDRSDQPSAEARAALIQARLAMTGPGLVPVGSSTSTPGSFRVALRPDGGLAAVADQTGPIRLYDTSTGDQVGSPLSWHTSGARALDFSSDGRSLVSGGSDKMVVRWDLSEIESVPDPTMLFESDVIVWALDIHPDDRRVVIAGDDGSLRLVDVGSGDELRRIEWTSGAGIISVRFTPDGERLIASNRDGRLQSWMVDGGDPLWAEDATPTGPNLWEIQFSPDGSRFVTAGDRDAAIVHDTATGRAVPGAVFGQVGVAQDGDADERVTQIHGVAFSSDGTRLIGGSASGAVHSWDIADPGDQTTTVSRHADAVEHGALSADGSIYVTVGDDKRLRVWRAPSVPVSVDRAGFADGAFGVAFDPSGSSVAVGDGSGGITLVSTSDSAAGVRIDAHDGVVRDLAWSADGSRLASIGDDGAVRLWDAEAMTLLATLGSHTGQGRSVAFSPDGRTLISADRGDDEGQDANVFVWDVEAASLRTELIGHAQGVRAIEFSLDGRQVATADGRGEIRLWDAASFEELRRWTATMQINKIRALSFSASGLLASADSSEDLRVWDPATGSQVGATVSGLGTDGATGVGFTADGDTIAVINRRGELRLVDWAQGVNLTTAPILAHPGAESFGLGFDPQGIRFATTGTDGVLRVWDLLSTEVACRAAGRTLDMSANETVLGNEQPVGCGVT